MTLSCRYSGLEKDFIRNSTKCSSRSRTGRLRYRSRHKHSNPRGMKSTTSCGKGSRSSRPRIGRSGITRCPKRISSGSRIEIDSRFFSEERRTSLITWVRRHWRGQRHKEGRECSSEQIAQERIDGNHRWWPEAYATGKIPERSHVSLGYMWSADQVCGRHTFTLTRWFTSLTMTTACLDATRLVARRLSSRLTISSRSRRSDSHSKERAA